MFYFQFNSQKYVFLEVEYNVVVYFVYFGMLELSICSLSEIKTRQLLSSLGQRYFGIHTIRGTESVYPVAYSLKIMKENISFGS